MRRKDREITDNAQIEDIINNAKVCRLGLVDDGKPYVVPLCFGYKDRKIYFHSAKEGRKIEILARNNNVCVEFDEAGETVKNDTACNWGMKYRSVICSGKSYFIDIEQDKRDALNVIMKHYSGTEHTFDDNTLEKTLVFVVEVSSISGKEKL